MQPLLMWQQQVQVRENQGHQDNTQNTWNSGCVLYPPCTRLAQKASIIITLGSLEPLFLSRDLWQSFASSPAGAKWLQQDWDPSSPNSGPHLLPGQLSSHPFLIYRKQQNSLAGRMIYERGNIEHTAWKNNQFPKLVNWLNWKLCL